MKVENMTSSRGNPVPNQFIISGDNGEEVFQSYKSVIVKIVPTEQAKVINSRYYGLKVEQIYIDRDTWDYSVTTSKYRNQFLGENKAQTQAKIDSGEYILTDLNG